MNVHVVMRLRVSNTLHKSVLYMPSCCELILYNIIVFFTLCCFSSSASRYGGDIIQCIRRYGCGGVVYCYQHSVP